MEVLMDKNLGFSPDSRTTLHLEVELRTYVSTQVVLWLLRYIYIGDATVQNDNWGRTSRESVLELKGTYNKKFFHKIPRIKPRFHRAMTKNKYPRWFKFRLFEGFAMSKKIHVICYQQRRRRCGSIWSYGKRTLIETCFQCLACGDPYKLLFLKVNSLCHLT